MKLLAFAASSSKKSINNSLVQHAADRLRLELLPELKVELLDLNDYEMPIYSIDREMKHGIPVPARQFLKKIGEADALMVSYAEHNGLYTAAFKNLFDWASRIEAKVFQDKPMVVLSTSPGPKGGANVLKAALNSAPHFGAEVVSSLSVPLFHENFDSERGVIQDDHIKKSLGRSLELMAQRLDPTQSEIEISASDFGPSMWNESYKTAFAAYGTEPNDFLRAVAGRIPDGPVLVIAAGEGRNAVYLAKRGHEVIAMDQSTVGLKHAAVLASRHGVRLTTIESDLSEFDFGESCWAAVVSIWAHVPPKLRSKVHAACTKALQPGGVYILEAYAPAHLERPGKGGPPVAELLIDTETARRELEGLELELCQEVQRPVSEGRDHNGPSTTTQVLAVRPSV
jgi:NAD(P)H-dependent FMN reductase/SAM-dependent methyltransferase